MAPVCSNCGHNEFVWAGELKTGGRLGAGPLSLRLGGELPLGTRICRECGHADLFLKDVSVLKTPHTWKPNEFVVIAAPPPEARASSPAPSPRATPPPVPVPVAASPPPPPAPPPEPAPEPGDLPPTPDPYVEAPAPAPSYEVMPSEPDPMPSAEPLVKPAPKRRAPRARKAPPA